jgi:hypothetical protein
MGSDLHGVVPLAGMNFFVIDLQKNPPGLTTLLYPGRTIYVAAVEGVFWIAIPSIDGVKNENGPK